MTRNAQESNRGDSEAQQARPSVREQDLEALRADLAAAESAEEVFTTDRLKELLLLESGADPATLERPYLEAVPEQYAARLTVFEWLEFALERGGSRRTLQALEYYVDIGWLGETAAEDLKDYVRVFQDASGATGDRPFETADHLVSLVYVARLSSMR
ncbi:MAG: FlaD/FlaE family flagellar protein [Halodesulfurarchaeum sp.]